MSTPLECLAITIYYTAERTHLDMILRSVKLTETRSVSAGKRADFLVAAAMVAM